MQIMAHSLALVVTIEAPAHHQAHLVANIRIGVNRYV